MQAENQAVKNTASAFQWIEYRKKHEICYVKDFLKEHPNQPRSFYQTLDLPLPEIELSIKKPQNLNEVTDVLYKKILMHGQIQPISKIAKKNAKKKRKQAAQGNIQKDFNYYDQDDSFIDDEEQMEMNKHRNPMQLVYAQYGDFNSFEGSLADFVKSDIYRNRLEILDSVGREVLPDSPKRKLPEQTTIVVPPGEKPKEMDKVKKKVKKTTPSKEKPVAENTQNQKTPTIGSSVAGNITPGKTPQGEKMLPPELARIMQSPQSMFPQLSHFNPMNFMSGSNGPSCFNPLMFYKIMPTGLQPMGFPLNQPNPATPAQTPVAPQPPATLPHKKQSEIIEIDHE